VARKELAGTAPAATQTTRHLERTEPADRGCAGLGVAADFQFDTTPMVDRSTSCPSSMSTPASRRPSRQRASTRLTLGQVRYHPEAIMLGVAPAER
jgi:hypothetical protein